MTPRRQRNQPTYQHIFISYARRDTDGNFAHRLAHVLREAGHQVWLDGGAASNADRLAQIPHSYA
ncbi:MAG: TIR domain-containing protein, partial [Chloroflexi bacterium]|nr:TIR domain-containing protein [Chloroflexota bacterium]